MSELEEQAERPNSVSSSPIRRAFSRKRDLLNLAWESAPVPMVIVDRRTRLKKANAAFTKLVGESRVRKLRWADLIHPEDLMGEHVLRTQLQELNLPKGTREIRIKTDEGSFIWVRLDMANLGDDVVIHLRDVTDQRKANDIMAASERRFRALVQYSNDLLAVVRPDGTVSYMTPNIEQLLGYRSDELVGVSIYDILHHSDISLIRGLVSTGGSMSGDGVEYRLRHRNGHWVYMEGTFRDLTTNSDVRGVVVNARDVSERKRLELQLRHAQKLETVGMLAAGVAHEVNTPIQFASDNIRFLEEAFDALMHVRAGEKEDDIEYITNEIPRAIEQTLDGMNRVTHIVQALKQFGYRDNGERKPSDVNEAIENTLAVAHNELKYVADVRTEFEKLPPVTCCIGDLKQVVLNLLINAAHAIKDRGDEQKGRIVVKTWQESKDQVGISVSDTGVGIPAENREKVFEPFFTTKEVGRGTGQGLALARAIVVDQHHGSLSFETESGVGTTFYIRLPIRAGELVTS